MNTGAAASSGLSPADAQGILVAIAPVIGTARTVAAASSIAERRGPAIALAGTGAENGDT
ncbi:MAG TPA: hypothetical protein VMF65_15675 [Acidimicrobiales bacterium]|nr:hypothetical protein [Acidimicrobiales bacterium]